MATHTFTFDTILLRGRNEREHDVTVQYTVTDYVPARLYGDYPQPAEGGEIEIISVKANGAEFPTTRDEDDRLLEQAEDRAAGDLASYYADAEEYRAEQAAERRRERVS